MDYSPGRERERRSLESYLEKQAKCEHAKRDPRGTCYECGQEQANSLRTVIVDHWDGTRWIQRVWDGSRYVDPLENRR